MSNEAQSSNDWFWHSGIWISIVIWILTFGFGNVVPGFSLVPHDPEGSHYRVLRRPNAFDLLRIALLDTLI